MRNPPAHTVKHFTVSEAEAGQKLLSYLKRRLGQDPPESLLHRIIRSGEVRINGKRAKPFTRVQKDDVVRVPPLRVDHDPFVEKAAVAHNSLCIVAETPEYLLLNKPAGLPSQPGSKQQDDLSSRLAAAYPEAEFSPTLVHRLDKDTSGLMLAAKTYQALRAAQEALHDGAMLKDYLAWVEGGWPEDAPLELYDLLEKQDLNGREKMVPGQGKEALCLARPILAREGHTLLLVRLLTGRTHQIRVQLSSRGHPISGDTKYGSPAKPPAPQGMCLHAWRLSLPDGQIFTAPPPWRGVFTVDAPTLAAIPITT